MKDIKMLSGMRLTSIDYIDAYYQSIKAVFEDGTELIIRPVAQTVRGEEFLALNYSVIETVE